MVSRIKKIFYLIILLLFILLQTYASCVLAESKECVIRNNAVGPVKIGDSSDKIFSFYKSAYEIKEVNKPDYARQISLFKKDKVIMNFTIGSDNKIFLIDIFDQCVTPEKIGPGSLLLDAMKAYGNRQIVPTESGYYVYFKRPKGVMFLLNNKDIPKELRDIPDDVFTSADEKRILGINTIKIIAIQLFVDE
jgi:hypothetical protein